MEPLLKVFILDNFHSSLHWAQSSLSTVFECLLEEFCGIYQFNQGWSKSMWTLQKILGVVSWDITF